MAKNLAWSEKYRPKCFGEIIGQREVVERLRALSSMYPPRPIVLSGPSGSGKTTLARIYAQATMCRGLEEGRKPCGTCPSCEDWKTDQRPNFYPLNCGAQGTVDDVRYLLDEIFPRVPMAARVHLAFFDEAHRLSLAARDALLPAMEDGSLGHAGLIFSLIDPDVLPQQFRNRCRVLHLNVPSIEERIQFVERIADGESLSFERGATELLAAYTSNFRELATYCEAIAEEVGNRPIDLASVRRVITRGGIAQVLDYLLSVSEGNWEAQIRALEAVRLTPPEKAEAILGVLTHVKTQFLGPGALPLASGRYGLLLDQGDCATLVENFARRAEWTGQSIEDLFDQVLEYWLNQPARVNETSLQAMIVRFNDLMARGNLHPVVGSDRRGAPSSPAQRTEMAASRLRHTQPWRAPDSRNRFLNAQQAKEIYEAATFMLQRYGQAFNTSFEINHGILGVADEAMAKQLVSELLRELGQNLSRWSPEPEDGSASVKLHRIALHERSEAGSLYSTIILHLPKTLVDEVEHWVFERFLNSFADTSMARRAVTLDHLHHAKRQGQGPRHWELVRLMWRGLDPGVQFRNRPLADLLGVPVRKRRPAGIVGARRFSVSHSLSSASRMQEARDYKAHLSAFDDRAWDWIDRNWEFARYDTREAALRNRERFLEQTVQELEKARDSFSRETLHSLRDRQMMEWKKLSKNNDKPWNFSG